MKLAGVFFLLLCTLAAAQTPDTVLVSTTQILILPDTVFAPEKDTFYVVANKKYKLKPNPYKTSQEFYRKMAEISSQNKITSKIFELLYTREDAIDDLKPKKHGQSSHTRFRPYEELIISKIRIVHVDVLEGSVRDTTRSAQSYFGKVINRTHPNTWNVIIRNNLLIEEGEKIDSYAMADAERVIRRLRYIEDAKIYVKPVPFEPYAEVIVVVKDRFSWAIAAEADNISDFSIELFNRNIGGSGNFAAGRWFYDQEQPSPHGYEVRAGGQHINELITDWELNHLNNGARKSWGASAQREFIASKIKYGGGLEVRTTQDSVIELDGTQASNANYHLNKRDLWVGRSFSLKNTNDRKNFILSARWLNHDFKSQPMIAEDTNSLYLNRNILLGEISIFDQRFLKTNYIQFFGISEDVPTGYRFSFITGKDFNELNTQTYYGFQLYGSFYLKSIGYFLFREEVGGFDRDDKIGDGVVRTRLGYYSPLFKIGRYHLRNFMNLAYTGGINQDLDRGIQLDNRSRDFEQDLITGNSALTFRVESVLFSPWYYYGFRFAPFAYYSLGEVWDSRGEKSFSATYQGLGIGFRVRNESLVFNTLELRMVNFISNPGMGSPVRFSLRATIPLRFENVFDFKPALVAYR